MQVLMQSPWAVLGDTLLPRLSSRLLHIDKLCHDAGV